MTIGLEYKILNTDNTGPMRESFLNGLGEDGWELASTVSYRDHELWIFKRHLIKKDQGDIKKIASWIWKKSHLDMEDESWNGMMVEDAIKAIRNLVAESER